MSSKSTKLRTDSLFLERNKTDLVPLFTLSEQPKDSGGTTYPSFYQEFMKCSDEYEAATELIGSKTHWDRLKKCKWFTEGWKDMPTHRGLNAWLEEMKERDISLAKGALIKQVKKGNSTAAKTLIEIVNKDGTPPPGRPKKEDINYQAARQAEEERGVEDDLKRLNVVPLRD